VIARWLDLLRLEDADEHHRGRGRGDDLPLWHVSGTFGMSPRVLLAIRVPALGDQGALPYSLPSWVMITIATSGPDHRGQPRQEHPYRDPCGNHQAP
jgi:hypothetical protein